MSIWQIIGIVCAVGISAVLIAAGLLLWGIEAMERERRELGDDPEGIEIDGGWLFDAPAPDSHHHTPRNHGEGDGVGELGVGQVHGKGL